MGKYIPSLITQELKKFYVIPTIGIDWVPGLSFNIGLYVGSVSFQLGWSYGNQFTLSNLNLVDSDLTLSDLEIIIDSICENKGPNEKLIRAAEKYNEYRKGNEDWLDNTGEFESERYKYYSAEYSVYKYNCINNKVGIMDFNEFINSKEVENNLDTTLDNIPECCDEQNPCTCEPEFAKRFELNTRKAEYRKYLSNLANHMTFDQWLEGKNKE